MKRFPRTSIFHRWIVNFMGKHLIEGFAGWRIASSTVTVARLIHQFALLFVWELLVCHVEGAVPRTQRDRTKAIVARDQCWLVVSAQAVVAAFNGGNHAVDFSGIHLLPVPLRIVRQKTQLCGIANPNVVHNKLFWLILIIGIDVFKKPVDPNWPSASIGSGCSHHWTCARGLRRGLCCKSHKLCKRTRALYDEFSSNGGPDSIPEDENYFKNKYVRTNIFVSKKANGTNEIGWMVRLVLLVLRIGGNAWTEAASCRTRNVFLLLIIH